LQQAWQKLHRSKITDHTIGKLTADKITDPQSYTASKVTGAVFLFTYV
jgi:hypothetical protein